MKNDLTQSIIPTIVAPVQRSTSATISHDGTAIAQSLLPKDQERDKYGSFNPFAGDDAE